MAMISTACRQGADPAESHSALSGLVKYTGEPTMSNFIEQEEREEDEEEVSITEENLNMEDEEDGIGYDHDEPEDEEDMPFAEPGQEGISVWDLLGKGFMKEVAEIGQQFLN
jgi:hypothetical protein